jgi:predicted RecA/RadA family phage recombinase
MKTYSYKGDIVSLTAPSGGVTAGTPVVIGSVFCVPISTAAEAAAFAAMVEGVHLLSKTSAQAWAEGDRLYWNAGTSKVANLPGDGKFIGFAVAVAANPSSTGYVRLCPGIELAEGAQAAVADIATADADGTYGSPEATLINELKTQLNTLLAELRIAGIIAA